VNIEALDPASFDDAIEGLGALLKDAVDGGASVNFLAGVTPAEATAWWAARSAGVAGGAITVFVARDGDRIVGSTLLERSRNPNSPHRAEIGKVIVHRSARRQGLGRALMHAAEERARSEGRWMLVLDTVTGSPAAALYESLGWQTVGTIPGYALDTAGVPEAATYYYKDLR
jgi:GNAT superfamily N-acetyltransferase